jgi:hypothetical protein
MNPLHWCVLVEEYVTAINDRRVTITQMHPANDFEHALWLAQQTALYHQPSHPARPRSRSLFRTQDGGWVVQVTGAASTFHFRVSVTEYYGDFPGRPSA